MTTTTQMYIIQLITLLLVGAVDAKTALVPKTSLLMDKKALLVRGGAGPLDVKTTTKVMSGILAAQGAYNYLAPEKNNEAYGMTDCEYDLTNLLSKGFGATILTAAIPAIGIFYFDMNPTTALGAGMTMATVVDLESVLNEAAAKNGFPKRDSGSTSSPTASWHTPFLRELTMRRRQAKLMLL